MPDEAPYRVVSGTVHKREDAGEGDDAGMGDLVAYRPGDVVHLREEQAEAFEVEPVEGDVAEQAESGTQSDAGADATEASDDADVTVDGAESGPSGDESAEPPDPLTDEWVEGADYDALRSAARRYDDVNGNWGADRLRAELAEKAE